MFDHEKQTRTGTHKTRLKLTFEDGSVHYLPIGTLGGIGVSNQILTAEWETRDGDGKLVSSQDAILKW